jgi:hypothetical protein
MDKIAVPRNAPRGERMVRAAQYLRMSTEHQTYSIDNQKDAIRDYADIMGYDIVATYEDAGRSGLNLGASRHGWSSTARRLIGPVTHAAIIR